MSPNPSTLSRVRAAAGRAGAAARWAGVEREPTVKVRVYVSDAARIKAIGGTFAQAVHTLLTRAAAK